MRTAWTFFWKGLFIIAVLVGALRIAMLAVNLRDEPISAQVLAMRALPANSIPDRDNIFLALVGADAPADASPAEVGLARIAAYNAALQAKDAGRAGKAAKEADAAPKVAPLRLRGTLAACKTIDAACWREVPDHRAEIAALMRENAVLVGRYRALQGLAGYHDTALYDVMRGGYPPTLAFGKDQRRLYIADLALRLRSGESQVRRQAFSDLGADIETWRRVLVGQGTLISSLVALACIHGDELLVALAIADPATGVADEPDGIVPPTFAPGDFQLGTAFAAEFRAMSPMWQQLRDDGGIAPATWVHADGPAARFQSAWLQPGNLLLRPGATANLQAQFFTRLIAAAGLPPDQFLPAEAQLQRWSREHTALASIRALYNPLGRTMLDIATPSYGQYVRRSWDVAAFQRLVRLCFEIRRQRIGPDDIPRFMQAHPEWSTHPMDHRPFTWNRTSRTLAVQVLGKHPQSRSFEVPVWQPAR
jgi:hypothetical protein